MGNIIKRFSDGSFLEYDTGSFDDWCVYYTDNMGIRNPPRDADYFAQLILFSQRYGSQRIYDDFVKVYDMTEKEVSTNCLIKITQIATAYGSDRIAVDVVFSILYMAMIAEERKKYTRLGKRIKRLGVYSLLIENKSVKESANFMRNKGWREIDALCRARGF